MSRVQLLSSRICPMQYCSHCVTIGVWRTQEKSCNYVDGPLTLRAEYFFCCVDRFKQHLVPLESQTLGVDSLVNVGPTDLHTLLTCYCYNFENSAGHHRRDSSPMWCPACTGNGRLVQSIYRLAKNMTLCLCYKIRQPSLTTSLPCRGRSLTQNLMFTWPQFVEMFVFVM